MGAGWQTSARYALISIVASTVLVGCLVQAQDSDPTDGLHRLTGKQRLPRSHATFVVPHGSALFVGNDAKVANDRTMDGSTDAEAVLEDADRTTYISYFGSGFIASDHWSLIDAQTLLSEIRDTTNDENASRSLHGLPTYSVGRWIMPPKFDSRHAVATCMYVLDDSRGVSADNGVALILGRHGYELLSMFGLAANVNTDREAFERYLVGFSFPVGGRYEDHRSSDKRAAFDLPTAFRGESGGGP